MKLSKLLSLLNKHNIPLDADIQSDSGWECDATDVDGVYYNQVTNTIVLTQEVFIGDDYHDAKDWIVVD